MHTVLEDDRPALDILERVGITEEKIASSNPTLLDNAIKEARGHSEDYMHHLMNDGDFMRSIKEQLPEGADRFCLVITSTLDACKRCAWKVEEMVHQMEKSFGGEEKVCKALYFATKQMRDMTSKAGSSVSEYSEVEHPITEDNLSSSGKNVIHAKPNPGTICKTLHLILHS